MNSYNFLYHVFTVSFPCNVFLPFSIYPNLIHPSRHNSDVPQSMKPSLLNFPSVACANFIPPIAFFLAPQLFVYMAHIPNGHKHVRTGSVSNSNLHFPQILAEQLTNRRHSKNICKINQQNHLKMYVCEKIRGKLRFYFQSFQQLLVIFL